jgi:cytochrome c peroxidase
MQHALIKTGCMVVAFVCLAAVGTHTQPATPYQLEYPAYFSNRLFMPADNPLTEEGVYLGRRLFYETKLSANNRISCAHCHQQERAFTDGLAFSKGVDGTPTTRNSMSLANLAWIRNFFWDGRANGLEAQAQVPLTDAHEMGQALALSAKKLQATRPYPALFQQAFGSSRITGDHIVKALAQFERTLISANAKYDQYLRDQYKPTAAEQHGMDLFFSNANPATNKRGAGCGHCHGGPKTFTEQYHNNGLDSISKDVGRETITGRSYDRGRFRVATLRNIALTAPYMHDGRFATLEGVVDHYNEHIQQSATLSIFFQNNQGGMNGNQLGLTAAEKKDLIAFLHMLTDSSFITDTRFSNPFIKQ